MADQRLRIDLTARDRTGAAFASVRRELRSIRESVDRVRGGVKGMFAGLAVAGAARQIVGINAEFQRLRATLETFSGDAAADVFRILQEYARTTPESLADVVRAFGRLQSAGLTPTMRAMRAYGDIAAGVGKRTIDFVEAVADASMGEYERLKEFGIRSSRQGDRVAITFRGLTNVVGASAREIEAHLMRLAETEFGGGLERQARTLTGAWSNLSDSLAALSVRIGEGGLNAALTDAMRGMSDMISMTGDLGEALGGALGGAVRLAAVLLTGLGTVAVRLARTVGVAMDAVGTAVSGITQPIGQAVADGLAILRRWANLSIGLAVGSVRGMIAAFRGLAPAMGDLTVQAANAVMDGLRAMLNGSIRLLNDGIGRINAVLDGVGAPLISTIDLLPDDWGRVRNAWTGGAAQLGADVSAAFRGALDVDWVGRIGDALSDLTTPDARPSPSIDELDRRLREVLGPARDAGAALDGAAGAMRRTGEAAGGAGRSTGRLAGRMLEVRTATDGLTAAWRDMSRTMADALGGGLADVITGTRKISDVVADMSRSIVRSAMQAVSNAAVRQLFGGLLSGSSASGALSLGGLSGLFAAGGVFSGGREVRAFASGGVVSGPTVFPMRSGLGLMGEAGPEAIMPLARGSDGKLGVRAAGGAPVNVVMNITAQDAESFRRNRGRIAAELARAVAEGRRNL